MNEETLQVVLEEGLDNIPGDMKREEIIATLTNRGLNIGEGISAMKSLWSTKFNDKERLDIVNTCYETMLDKWLDESTSDEPNEEHMNEITLVLKEIDNNRKGIAEIVYIMSEQDKMQTSLMDKVLKEFDTEEMPRC